MFVSMTDIILFLTVSAFGWYVVRPKVSAWMTDYRQKAERDSCRREEQRRREGEAAADLVKSVVAGVTAVIAPAQIVQPAQPDLPQDTTALVAKLQAARGKNKAQMRQDIEEVLQQLQ